MTFQCVAEFRYLGLLIDQSASARRMVEHRLGKARGAFATLCEFVGVQRWGLPWMRLVLFDVYVTTHLLFGAAVWGATCYERGMRLGGQ